MSSHHSDPPIRRRLMLSLAWADLRHDWMLSLCLIMALMALMAPLLTLFGLKYGSVDTLRSRLIQDPRNREIRPVTSVSYEREWFDEMAARPDVGFIVPLTRQIASSVTARHGGDGISVSLDLVASAPGDPLLLENNAAIPGTGECVLSAQAAEALAAETGDVLTLFSSRVRAGVAEQSSTQLTVTGILDKRATTLSMMYVPLRFLEAIEMHKDGQAVPELGWPGSLALASPLYDGAIVKIPKPLPRQEELALLINTGFTEMEHIEAPSSPGMILYRLSTADSGVDADALTALELRLRGNDATIQPWIRPLPVQLVHGENDPVPLHIETGEVENDYSILLPSTLSIPPGSTLLLRTSTPRGTLELPVTATGESGSHLATVSTKLAGILRLARHRHVEFIPELDEFSLARTGYAGFRLYARTIEDVEPLKLALEAEGITVHTQAERIRDVHELDRYLTVIFWIIASIGLLGGMAALVASLFAAAERKRRELSILRLIGIDRGSLMQFPLYQSLILMTASMLGAYLLFTGISTLINGYFSSYLQTGEQLCHLPVKNALSAFVGGLLIAAFASLAAARRIARIETGDGLRDE